MTFLFNEVAIIYLKYAELEVTHICEISGSYGGEHWSYGILWHYAAYFKR
jgi:hypothetical protein